MQSELGFFDFLIAPIYIIIFYLVCKRSTKKNIENKVYYKYLIKGLYLKLFGVILFVLFYQYYYSIGDTVSYFKGSRALVMAAKENLLKGVHLIFNTDSWMNDWSSFLSSGYTPPLYMWRDDGTFIVSRLTTIFYILGFGSFLVTSFFTCIFSYIGLWSLYSLFNEYYPNNHKIFFYTIIAVPSVLFWGGGIMKDSFVIGATSWATSSFFNVFIFKKKRITNALLLILNFVIIINIKSYVAISLFPAMILALLSISIKSLKSNVVKTILGPIIILIFASAFSLIFNNLSAIGIEQYQSVDETIEQAKIIQQDLLREEQYGSNNYYIGELDGTIGGMLKIAPMAIYTALLRPLPNDVGSVTMVISAIENTLIAIFILIVLVKTSPIRVFKSIGESPILIYSITFIIIFAFGVGIASTNFGALVRYKIPLVPFFLSFLYIVSKKNI